MGESVTYTYEEVKREFFDPKLVGNYPNFDNKEYGSSYFKGLYVGDSFNSTAEDDGKVKTDPTVF